MFCLVWWSTTPRLGPRAVLSLHLCSLKHLLQPCGKQPSMRLHMVCASKGLKVYIPYIPEAIPSHISVICSWWCGSLAGALLCHWHLGKGCVLKSSETDPPEEWHVCQIDFKALFYKEFLWCKIKLQSFVKGMFVFYFGFLTLVAACWDLPLRDSSVGGHMICSVL